MKDKIVWIIAILLFAIGSLILYKSQAKYYSDLTSGFAAFGMILCMAGLLTPALASLLGFLINRKK